VLEHPDRLLVRMARRAEIDHVALQAGWPARVRIIAAPFDHEPATLPYVFAPAFGFVDDARLRRFSLACRLYADVPRLEREGALAARLELHALLPELFAGDARVWPLLRELDSHRAWALAEEELYAGGRRALTEFDDDSAAQHARSKDAVPLFVVRGLALLADDDVPLAALAGAAGAVAEGSQLIADVRRWRDDLATRRATFATARLARAFPSTWEPGHGPDLAAPFYLGGIATELTARAGALLDGAARAFAAHGDIRWKRLEIAREQAADMVAALRQAAAAARASPG
jgi:hypothetical protein